jgi:Ca-activated chloride channel family protein
VHKDGEYGYLTVVLIPPKKPKPEQIAPKEMIFVIDRSGSQRGLPLQKAKETMNYILDKMNPDDTFNVICFSNRIEALFESPRKKTDEMVKRAKEYIGALDGRGGTWMGPAVEAVCAAPAAGNRLRIVTFMTDGYVGNDFAILGLVKKLRGKSRWFPFGTGNSVNRFLLDNMAKLGGGEVDYVLLNSPGEKVASKFYNRISTPVLTDVKVEFEGIELEEIFPKEVSDLWAQKPLYFHARYKKPGKGKVYLKGYFAGKPYKQELEITLPETDKSDEVLGPMWARAKVDMLMNNDLFSAQRGSVNKELREEIILTALEHHIMTQYTSFVAVEETIITVGGKPRKVAVPVEMPQGVSREGVFGRNEAGGAQFGRARKAGRWGGGVTGKKKELAEKMPSRPAPRPSGLPKEAKEEERPAKDKPMTPEEKRKQLVKQRELLVKQRLHKSLIGLAGKVAKEGKDGSFKLDKFEVKDNKVTVNIYLKDNSEEVLKKIKALGIKILFEGTAVKMVIALVHISKLEDLAQIEAVKLIEPTTE